LVSVGVNSIRQQIELPITNYRLPITNYRLPMTTIEQFLSPENFQRAWEKVAEKKGSAGIDGESIADFRRRVATNLSQLRESVANSTYQPLPYQQVLIPKSEGSWRDIRIPTVRDRIVQQALLNVLHPITEDVFSSASFAYRPHLSYINAVEKVASWRDLGYVWVLDADIVRYFDSINHQRLLREVQNYIDNPGILCLIKAWISVEISTPEGMVRNDRGIPQGSVISPLLANIYLDEFDRTISASDVKLVRYADDFLVLARTRDRIVAALSEVQQLLAGMGLELHPQKTQIAHFDRGFRFLGHAFLEDAIFPVKSKKSQLEKEKVKKSQAKADVNSKTRKKKDIKSLLRSLMMFDFTTSEYIEVEGVDLEQVDVERVISLEEDPPLTPLKKGGDRIKVSLKKGEDRIKVSLKKGEDEIKVPLFKGDLGGSNTVSAPLSQGWNSVWNREMATLYLTEQGTTVYKEHQRFVIQVSQSEKLEIPIRDIERILIFGNIQLTMQVIGACLQEQVAVLFLSQSGQYRGHLWSLNPLHLDCEIVQLKKHQDVRFQLETARSIIRGKLFNSKQFLVRLNRKRKVAGVAKAIEGITSDLASLEFVDNIDRLRGYEGIGAARYFPAFGQLITNPAFSFSQRFRHPPTDPVNALLSFGYTILLNNVVSAIVAEGLSPYFGNLHYGDDRKTYLAFDLMEEFRSPIIDSLVLKSINSEILKPKDFEPVMSPGGIYLTSSARRVFLEQLEKRMNEEISHPDLQSPVSYRQAIGLQIRRYKRSLLHEVAYEPFLRLK
jgi:CRISPR-associated protein Cas1